MFVYLLLLSLACLAIQGFPNDISEHENGNLQLVRAKRQNYYNYPYNWGYWIGSQYRPPYYRRTTRTPFINRPTTTTRRSEGLITSPLPDEITSGAEICPCTRRFKRQNNNEVDRNMTDSFRIVGGTPTRPHSYPQMALVIYNGNQMCGGTILNTNYILTAAHCVRGNTDVSKYEVTVGAYDLNDREANRKSVKVKNAFANPDFNTRTFQNDIALLQLAEPLVFNSDVKPTCLSLNQNSYSGDDGIAVGWGRTSESGSATRVLREVTVPIITNRECQTYYSGLYTIFSNMICAGDKSGGKDSCAGDSGGPLFVSGSTSSPIQVGVTSFGLGCARREKPGVYTRLTEFSDWIKNNVKLDVCKIYSDNN